MENKKLQELTEKLYTEGLSKGREEAEKMVADAEAKAAKLVAQAQQEAAEIVKAAEAKAAELKKNNETEMVLATRQVVAALKENITNLVVAKSVEPSVHAALIDVEFVKEMLLGIARGWNGERVALEAILPAQMKEKFEAEAEAAVKALLAEGIEVGYSEKVKSGFKVAPKDGGYYISFTEEDFSALLAEYLKEKVVKMLY
jgi:V/A-type H+-transporting ATPase subunit E